MNAIVPMGGGMSPAAVLDAIKAAQANPMRGLEKATFAQGTSPISGLTYYDLELGAKMLYPVPTPLRNLIPRVSGKGGIQANWRAITGINVNGLRVGVSQGNRGAVQAVGERDYTASYKGIGIESSVTFEATYAAQGFDDVRAIAADTGLKSLMLGEEALILGGNASMALGTTPTPTVSASTAGGALPAQTWSVICVALSLDAIINSSLVSAPATMITRSNADGTTDTFGGGAAAKSANTTIATTGSTSSIAATVTPVIGAMGYAWYWGAPGAETLGAITTISSVSIVAPPQGTALAASLGTVDGSTNSLVFDGLLTQALKPGSGSIITVQPAGTAGIGTPLTADGAAGIVEIDATLKQMWDLYRLGPDTMWVSSQEALNVSRKILAGSANAAQRFMFTAEPDKLAGGIMVRTYLNKYSMAGGSTIDINIHPNLPAGTILFTSKTLPYALSNVGNVVQIRTRQEYYQIEWPLVSRSYAYGVYADEVLQHYFPPSMAVITNIGNG